MPENHEDQIWSLLQDDLFIQWVNEPDGQTVAYWDNWLKQNPGQSASLQKARQIILDITRDEMPADAYSLSEHIWSSVNRDIDTRRKMPVAPVSASPAISFSLTQNAPLSPVIAMDPTPKRPSRYFFRVAAAVLALVFLGSAVYYYRSAAPARIMPVEQKIASIIVNNDLKRFNPTPTSQVVYLVDGSKVVLEPGASIKHAVFLQKDKREIYLEGDAFFEVAKDPGRPFYVYTRDIVMRVLGTSFNVKTNAHNGDVTVVVRTGKVSVYKNSNRKGAQLILTSNQRALYSAQTRLLAQSGLDSAGARMNKAPVSPSFNFNFEEMPVSKIFRALENAYGITIRYNEKNLSNCKITTSLGEEVYEEKLKIICAAIGAKYRIEGNGVSIEGGSCQNE